MYMCVWMYSVIRIFDHALMLPVIQVNPHTHQLKLCDFGSAKVLVSISGHPVY